MHLAEGKEGFVDGAGLLEHAIAGLRILHPLAASLRAACVIIHFVDLFN